MSSSEDTEITLGTGKMLALFFGLVALCAVFFGMGFKVGRNSAAPASAGDSTVSVAAANGGTRPSAVKQTADSGANASPDVAFYKPDNSPRAEPGGSCGRRDRGSRQSSEHRGRSRCRPGGGSG